eukprot:2939429-Amphidinium_carterae.1
MELRLIESEWNVPVRDVLMPGQEGVCMLDSAADVPAIVQRMKGMQGAAAVLTTERTPGISYEQKSVVINVRCKHGDLTTMKRVSAWLTQVGDKVVECKQQLDVINIVPGASTTAVVRCEVPKKYAPSDFDWKRDRG